MVHRNTRISVDTVDFIERANAERHKKILELRLDRHKKTLAAARENVVDITYELLLLSSPSLPAPAQKIFDSPIDKALCLVDDINHTISRRVEMKIGDGFAGSNTYKVTAYPPSHHIS